MQCTESEQTIDESRQNPTRSDETYQSVNAQPSIKALKAMQGAKTTEQPNTTRYNPTRHITTHYKHKKQCNTWSLLSKRATISSRPNTTQSGISEHTKALLTCHQ
eukprot:scaffold149238_cov18-Prasinocladus_malaysianus.AAC.1